VDDFHGVDRRQWPWKTVADFMRPVTGDTISGPQTDAADAIAQMRKLGEQSLIVVRDHEFVGTVAMTDLLRLLSIKMRLEPDSVS